MRDVAIHKAIDGSMICVCDFSKVSAITATGTVITYYLHNETLQICCKTHEQAQRVLQDFVDSRSGTTGD